MDIQALSPLLARVYKKRKLYQYDPFIRFQLLTEEVANVSEPFDNENCRLIDR